MRKILSTARRAATDYNMIEAGDKIAVCVSGGKDSLTLLSAMAGLQKFFPARFSLVAMTLSMGFDGMDFSPIGDLCGELGIEYIVEPSEIAEILFDIRKETNPCSLCAKMRRGALNNLAKAHGCNKIALGHHNEDVIETFFLSLFYEGRLSCFRPVTYLSNVDITVIRPLIYTAEADIRGYAKRAALPVVHNPCPMDGKSKRQDMKDFINQKSAEDRHFKKRTFHAIQTGIEGWRVT